jgi:hypothetical protein
MFPKKVLPFSIREIVTHEVIILHELDLESCIDYPRQIMHHG